MDTGTAEKNTRIYVNLTAICQSVGPQICAALPGFHAYTGSDYTSSFVRRGKVHPFAKVEKNADIQKALQELGTTARISQTGRKTLHSFTMFTVGIYGAKAKTTLNAHRYKVYEKSYGPKTRAKNPLDKLKGINASSIPPCEAEVNMHLKRASFAARMFVNADQNDIHQYTTVEDGWEVEKVCYQTIWHEGPQLPESLIPKEDKEAEESAEEEKEDEDMSIASSDEDSDDDE